MTDGAKAKHSEKMAELRRCLSTQRLAEEALAYADELAAERDELATKHKIVCECVKVVDGANESLRRQLEAERSVNAFALTEQVSGIENERDLWWAYRDATQSLKAAEDKLRAAERVVSALRGFSLCPICGGQDGHHATNCMIAAYDAINQGSRGGAGEGVGRMASMGFHRLFGLTLARYVSRLYGPVEAPELDECIRRDLEAQREWILQRKADLRENSRPDQPSDEPDE